VAAVDREFQLTLQAAYREALSRRHAYLTVEHLLFALCFDEVAIETLRACGVRVEKLKHELEQFFAENIEPEPGSDAIEVQQTLAFHRVVEAAVHHMHSAEKDSVDAGDVLAAIFQEPDCQAVAILRSLGVSRMDVLRYVSHGIRKADVPDEDETSERAPQGFGDEEEGEIDDPLAAFSTNLTERAAEGKLDPLVGRENEIQRAIHVLARRRKNNPIFVGESGVGKTALAEGLAQKIHERKVPQDLLDAEIYAVDLGAMLAGTRYRGDFEARFKAFVHAVQQRDNPIVFIDEIHTVLGAGAAQGATVDASSMLKPLLQSGELRCMGSTTYHDYRHFERDRALARRFQRIDVHEPSVEDAVKILEGLAPRYEEHHGVHYTAPALRAAVELSARHLQDRHLPDKAIDVMDEAGAAVRLRPASRRKKTVGKADVEALVARMAQVPIETANVSEREKLETLATELKAGVYGQDDAISTLTRAVKRTRAGLGGRDRPIGSFLFMGPTGVGKTELAKQLAHCLDVPFLRFDMSEYMEKHAVARLIGAPPGYVGYDEGGLLVERVRKNPYAVLLLDEIEKAHQDLFDILLQVMDHATLTDNHGREADFRHVTLIMTSNVGARDMTRRAIGFGGGVGSDGKREVERLFSPEFRNRLDEIVDFHQLTPDVMGLVVDKFIRQLEQQLAEKKVRVELHDAARSWLAEKGYEPDFGARPLARVLRTELEDKFADEILFGSLVKGGTVHVDLGEDELVLRFSPREPQPRGQ
jgi:ATP-dependent Clp protease ATP-binding subunit ClpA